MNYNDSQINVGSYIIINEKLKSELERLEFQIDIDGFCEEYVDTQQIVHQIWEDTNGEKYATIDLCVDIPIAACEKIVQKNPLTKRQTGLPWGAEIV